MKVVHLDHLFLFVASVWGWTINLA
jgi:hypothetical protein